MINNTQQLPITTNHEQQHLGQGQENITLSNNLNQENNNPQTHMEIELEHQPNQPELQQNLPVDQDPESQQEGEIAQQIDPEERQQIVENKPQQKQTSKTSIDKDSYINKMQTYLTRVKAELSQKSKDYDNLSQDNKKTKEALKKLRFEFLSSKQQISTLSQQRADLQKQKEILQKTNSNLTEQINAYKEAGDINFYKNKIVELEKLLEVQKKQLQMKEAMIDEKNQIEESVSKSSSNKVQILSLIEKYQTENTQLSQRHAQVCLVNDQLENQRQKLLLDLSQLKIRLGETHDSLALQRQAIVRLQEKLKNNEEEYKKKLIQAEEKIVQLINNQNIEQISQSDLEKNKVFKSPEELYGIRILCPADERDMIMRQFIELEIKYQTVTEELSNLRQRHYNTLRQVKNISTTHVSKKDYSELYKKYSKLRKCLESSLVNQQRLRNQLLRYTTLNNPSADQENIQIQSAQGEQANKAFSRYRSLVLEEPENEINKIQKILQKSSESQRNLFTSKQQLETKQKLIKTEKLLREKQEKMTNFQKQINKLTSLLQLYDNQLAYKNNQVSLLRQSNEQNLKRIYQLQTNTISRQEQHQLKTRIEEIRLLNQILQVKNIQCLKENHMLKNQKRVLTQIYTDLKTMYEQILNHEPQLQNQLKNSEQEKEKILMEREIQPCKQCQERQQRQKQITFAEIQIQTEGLAELYFKEIKQLLTILRKFPKKVDTITGQLEAEKSTIHEVKKRYDQVMEAYGVKYRQLEEQKKSNDQWRLKQRQEIREEFQEIRQLLVNERLITALRKAKSLIESYEQNAPEGEYDQNPEQGEEQLAQEKNSSAREQVIQQQKQNP